MKRKTLLICTAAVMLQMCFLTGCSDDKSKDTSENEPTVSESETSVINQDSVENETANSDNITSTDKKIILPEMEIEDDISETSQNVSVQSDKADNKAVTTAKTPVTAKNNTSGEETATKAVTTDVSAEPQTTVTARDTIELPEIDFN